MSAKAVDIAMLWMTDSSATQQDLSDACEQAGAQAAVPGELSEVGNTRWNFDDGSSIELTWNASGIYVRNPPWVILPCTRRTPCERGTDGYCARCHEEMQP